MENKQKKLVLEIRGMTCEHCARSIERKLSNLDGVLASSIDYQNQPLFLPFLSQKTTVAVAQSNKKDSR